VLPLKKLSKFCLTNHLRYQPTQRRIRGFSFELFKEKEKFVFEYENFKIFELLSMPDATRLNSNHGGNLIGHKQMQMQCAPGRHLSNNYFPDFCSHAAQ
jgi:hypothetical protein